MRPMQHTESRLNDSSRFNWISVKRSKEIHLAFMIHKDWKAGQQQFRCQMPLASLCRILHIPCKFANGTYSSITYYKNTYSNSECTFQKMHNFNEHFSQDEFLQCCTLSRQNRKCTALEIYLRCIYFQEMHFRNQHLSKDTFSEVA